MCPFRKTLEPGKTYKWCTCGKSRDALCDGTHIFNSDFVSLFALRLLYSTKNTVPSYSFVYSFLALLDTCDDNDVAPLEFQVSTKVRWRSVCACRYTATPPFCDGVHALDPEVGRDEYAQEHGIDLEALDVKARAEWKAKLESGSCCGCKDDSKEDNAAAAAPATTAEATTTTATVSATNNNDAGSSDKQDTSSTDVTPKIS